ncbi:MAG: 50S ribosomal protein L11 methyltransferase [Betaproteobacteria bacterium]|nr:MAG: 50S ribosomal protein L11 methyltransferase [Betaproteobacteria bacterium]
MTFTALVLEVKGEEVDSLSDALLDAGALSVSCENARAETAAQVPHFDGSGESVSWPRVKLTALCKVQAEPEQLLLRACNLAGIAVPVHELRSVPDEDWVARSREQFGPIRVSATLWIVPTWRSPPEPDAINLVLDPGLAFGTGSHPTTRLCLQWLERSIAGGETVLDYGCGSGILAIAALKLGARRAVGVDIDPDAVATARANARRNDVAGEFLEDCAPLMFTADVVIANILADPLKLLAPMLASRCRRGGRIALSGILPDQVREVESWYSPWIAFVPPAEAEGWVCLSGVKL